MAILGIGASQPRHTAHSSQAALPAKAMFDSQRVGRTLKVSGVPMQSGERRRFDNHLP
jgi:hypothetical protein